MGGDYRISGGPAPGIDHPIKGTVWAYPGQITWDEARSTPALAHVVTDARGTFEMRLPVGVYTLVGGQGTADSVGSDGCGTVVEVDVEVTRAQTVYLVCSVP